MVDVARTQFPREMTQTLNPDLSSLDSLATDVLERLQQYAREKPMAFGLWAFGIGFVVGWRLKPW
jgi:tetrahydromethanopterin S-methyltransferase subunit F